MTELGTLLRRDHDELDAALVDLARPSVTTRELRDSIDGVRLGLVAHDEAFDIVLSAVLAALPEASPLHLVVARSRTEHAHGETALSSLVVTPPHSAAWLRRIQQLRLVIAEHALREHSELVPLLERELDPAIRARLAGMFATERLRQLAMLQPSAPISVAMYAAL